MRPLARTVPPRCGAVSAGSRPQGIAVRGTPAILPVLGRLSELANPNARVVVSHNHIQH